MSVYGSAGGAACFDAARFAEATISAERNCDEALASNRLFERDRAATHINRAIVRSHRGDLVGALEDFEAARRLIPDIPESYVGEGNVAFSRGDFQAALTAYDLSLELGLRAAHAGHFNRGLALERLGRRGAAAEAYRAALAVSPGWDIAEANLERLSTPQTN